MLKKPMTTEELFNKIREIIKEKGKLPDILDYGLAAHNLVPIRTYEFDLKSNLTYGGNEGIYLSLWIEYFVNDERRTNSVGTFKTLDESNEAMHVMTGLLADFIIEEYAYVNEDLDDFTWEGTDVHLFDDVRKRISWGLLHIRYHILANVLQIIMKWKYTVLMLKSVPIELSSMEGSCRLFRKGRLGSS